MEEQHTSVSEEASSPLSLPEYLSVEEAATLLGVTTRSIYWYIEQGRLSCTRSDIYLLRREDVAAFERTAPGQVRTRTPRWRMPPTQNALSLTTMRVRVRPGQRKSFMKKVTAIIKRARIRFPERLLGM